ncbi:MAG TPA: hypothetical protein VML55_11325 [Planctomycetaceae bacterium]|nr:hypothetical protein [Planctomycetaceae bacterium]
MNLTEQLDHELERLAGFTSATPRTAALSAPDDIDLAIDFTAVDSMSCAFRELRLRVPTLAAAGFDALKAWAEALSKRITYLLENIGPLELDPAAGQVLIRSTAPDQRPGSTSFYEILLTAQGGGQFALRRYRSQKGLPGRDQVDVQVTHEVLRKLVTDLVETIPATA